MKKTLLTMILLISVLIYSCKEDNPDIAPNTQTSFDIGSVHYVSNHTTAYQTEFGQLLKITGDNFEMYIVFSDTASKIYTLVDTLTGSDVGKARCIFRTNNSFAFSTTGTLAYNSSMKSGTFEVNTEDLNIKNGHIKVDTTFTRSIIDFTKISENDVYGWPITLEDKTDWNIRTNWEVAERLVFNLKAENTLPSTIKLIEYPNPFINTFYLQLDIPQQSKADFYLMNANFEIEQKFIGISPGNYLLQLNHTLNKGEFYRLFYKIYSGSEQFYGTGDLKIME